MITEEMLETRGIMEGIANGLDTILNGDKRGTDRPYAFVLLIAPFNEDGASQEKGRVNYISNANREDIQSLLKEMVERWEEPGARRDVPPDLGGPSEAGHH